MKSVTAQRYIAPEGATRGLAWQSMRGLIARHSRSLHGRASLEDMPQCS